MTSSFTFGKSSEAHLKQVHPSLEKVVRKALELSGQDFTIICSYRGKAAQEKAFASGNTKVHYPNSAHNQTDDEGLPRSCAVDVIPYLFKGWDDRQGFVDIAKAMFAASNALNIPIRWGGDFNRDGDKTTTDAWDKPHFELDPWREWDKRG